jgi:hypothetical protein
MVSVNKTTLTADQPRGNKVKKKQPIYLKNNE